jgi:3-deoxy-D-manno-octulosonic acid (KDO) 8-phosphate synthase
MQLLGREVGLDQPIFLIAGPAWSETHPDPANAKSYGPNAWPLDRMESLLTTLVDIDKLVKERSFEEGLL